MKFPHPMTAGCPCPMEKCTGWLRIEDTGCGFDHLTCPECGYTPDLQLDHLIEDCPICEGYCQIINQGNVICSNCGLELTADDEPTAIRLWNSITRIDKDFEVKIRAVLSRYFGGAQFRGEFIPRYTPAAREIAALISKPAKGMTNDQADDAQDPAGGGPDGMPDLSKAP